MNELDMIALKSKEEFSVYSLKTYKNEDQKLQRTHSSPLTRQLTPLRFMSDEEVILKSRVSPEYSGVKYIIFPDDSFKIYWDLGIIVFVVYTMIITPYRISFTDGLNIEWDDFEIFIDVCFMMDVVVNCFSAIYIGQELVITHREIIQNYMKSWMVIDILSGVPFSIIFDRSGWGSMTKLLKLPRLYRCLKIAKILKMSNFIEKLQNQRFLSALFNLSIQKKRLLYFFLVILMMCHFLTCFWYFISTLEPKNNWVIAYNYSYQDQFDLYLVSLYWVVSTLATVGYGDIKPTNSLERTLCIFVMLLGVFFYSYTVGTISSIMANFNREQEKINNKLLVLQEIRREFKISKELNKRIIHTLKLNRSSSANDFSVLLKSLPRRLAVILSFHVNKGLLESTNKFFYRKPLGFICSIIERMKCMKVAAKEVLFVTDDLSDEIYFVIKGEVVIYIQYNSIDIELETMTEDDYFGEIGVLLNEPRSFFAKSTRFTDLMILSKDVLMDALKNFPALHEEIVKEVVERKNTLKEKSDKYVSEFIINRNLGKAFIGEENCEPKYSKSNLNDIKSYNSIKNRLSKRAVKLIEGNDGSVKELAQELAAVKNRLAEYQDLLDLKNES